MLTFEQEIKKCIKDNRYREAANLVAEKLNIEMTANFIRNGKHSEDDSHVRDIYKIGIKRGNRDFHFDYGRSIMDSQYYQDRSIPGNTYTLDGGNRTGKLKITDLQNFLSFLILKPGKPPVMYDVLACLVKDNPGTFENFCSDFGYNTDSIKARKTYADVKEQYLQMCGLFNEEELKLLKLIN